MSLVPQLQIFFIFYGKNSLFDLSPISIKKKQQTNFDLLFLKLLYSIKQTEIYEAEFIYEFIY